MCRLGLVRLTRASCHWCANLAQNIRRYADVGDVVELLRLCATEVPRLRRNPFHRDAVLAGAQAARCCGLVTSWMVGSAGRRVCPVAAQMLASGIKVMMPTTEPVLNGQWERAARFCTMQKETHVNRFLIRLHVLPPSKGFFHHHFVTQYHHLT